MSQDITKQNCLLHKDKRYCIRIIEMSKLMIDIISWQNYCHTKFELPFRQPHLLSQVSQEILTRKSGECGPRDQEQGEKEQDRCTFAISKWYTEGLGQGRIGSIPSPLSPPPSCGYHPFSLLIFSKLQLSDPKIVFKY